MSENGLMTAGEFAHRAGVTVRTIQYYDQKGLLSPSKKGRANQRLYSASDVQRLDRILTLKYLGFSLNSILKLDDGMTTAAEVESAVAKSREELDNELMSLFGRMATLKCLAEEIARETDGTGAPDEDGSSKSNGDAPHPDVPRSAEAAAGVDWCALARTIENCQRDDSWRRLLEEDATGSDAISRDEVLAWHALMGDTIEAMQNGATPSDEAAQKLAQRFRRLGGMQRARQGLDRMTAHPGMPAIPGMSGQGSPERGRDFYHALQKRTLGFLQQALKESGAGQDDGVRP